LDRYTEGHRIPSSQVVAGSGAGPSNPPILKGFSFSGLPGGQTDITAFWSGK